MIGESSATSTLTPPQTKASVLITISTPGADTPICRLGNSEEVVKGLTVRQLIQRVVSPNSLFSVGVPINQLQAESSTALAIGELLKAECCEVMVPGKGTTAHRAVSLDDLAREVAREQVGTQGNRFLNINLDVRSSADVTAPDGDERRHPSAPEMAEAESKKPMLLGRPVESEPRAVPASEPSEAPAREIAASGSAPASEPSEEILAKPKHSTPGEYVFSHEAPEKRRPVEASAMPFVKPPAEPAPEIAALASEPALDAIEAAAEPASEAVEAAVEPAAPVEQAEPEAAPAPKPAAPGKIVTILAEKMKDEPQPQVRDRKEYVRKADWLRAQFLPEVEALDFSGLFVGNLGLGIREEKARRNVVLADPARITEVLLRANGYRRTGDHPKALICYQELVDMDASNSDFRFLLGKTLVELGQREQAVDAFMRAKELGHDGAERELDDLKRSGHRPKAALGFLKFWKQ